VKNILLINLGSPDSLNINDIRKYLKEFLSDDLVIDLPKPIQQLILRLFILPFRPKKTQEAYKLIWGENGSPLIENTKNIANSLQRKTGWNVDFAMRYQNPSILNSIKKYKDNNITNVTILPLYPHNAISTTLSTELAIKQIVKIIFPKIKLSFINPFYNHPLYIEALSSSIKPYLSNIDKLIFSYHGIPERHIKKGDVSNSHCMKIDDCCKIDCKAAYNCYKSNVLTTSELCSRQLKLEKDQWMISFQSRVTIIDPNWLKPYTDIELVKLPKNGIKKIAVVCPSFVADCLETLEEIKIRGKETFQEAGGKEFTYIPCLNNNEHFISLLENLILNHHK